MGNYFQGWYFKCQSDTQTLAVIPAIHKSRGKTSCSIQLITRQQSWSVPYPASALRRRAGAIRIGENEFSEQGVRLSIRSPELTAVGRLRFGPFSPIRYDIMGPFRYVPFLECRHSVFSMAHSVSGAVHIHDTPYVFRNDHGYLEGDRGRSFPKVYAWTQAHLPQGSVMLSVAEIPLGGLHFTGVIGVVLWEGREYRLATYLGARPTQIRNQTVSIRQGKEQLTVRRMEDGGRPLLAPVAGQMQRTIHEHAACRVFYRFQRGSETLFALEIPDAAFEYEYPD